MKTINGTHMKKMLFLAVLTVLSSVSCQKSQADVPQDVYSLKVTLPSGMSWKNGDLLSAGVNNLSATLSGMSGETNTALFAFKKPLSEGAFVRFPGVSNPATLSIPAQQTSFGGDSDRSAVHMYGVVVMDGSASPSVELKRVTSDLKFSLKGDATIVRAVLDAVAEEPLSGLFNLDGSGGLSSTEETESTVNVVFADPLELNRDKVSDIHIPVPPASYSKGFRLTLYDDEYDRMVVMAGGEGLQLSSDASAGFNVVYSGGYMVTLEAGGDFGAGEMEELEAEPVFGEYSVQGKVVYDDGKPAVGVSVSDGFNVVQTNEKGMYAFKSAGADVRYIYITYPADAKVTVSSDGCPEFFQKYRKDNHVYDFTLIRQQVEKEFAIFAMADPQTHFAQRGSQVYADTDRYGAETVPALNAEIARQTLPCYGISLGDITYSEGNRDSTPSMEIIREHFSRVNMPIFNVMGNHDYTYYAPDASVSVSEGSSSINLLAQRSYEDVFGPVNFSFDRGNVHFVCMKDVHFNSTVKWDAGAYSGGFTDAEYEWLVQDLENTPRTRKVVLCVHIPVSTNNGPNMSKVKDLISQFTDAVVFSGHTHYQRTIYEGDRLYEQIHSAVCGQWWWSRIEGDGCPNGYTVHYFEDTKIKDAYFIGVNEGMNTRDYQMRIYKGNIRTGGKFAYFQMSNKENEYLINVFNGDQKWKIKVYEDDVYMGQADMIPPSKYTLVPGSDGQTHSIPTTSSQDWWSIGYHIGCCKRGTGGSGYQTANYHMWKWTASDPSAKIRIEAEDPYGNIYTCEDVITDGLDYPDYIKAPLTVL